MPTATSQLVINSTHYDVSSGTFRVPFAQQQTFQKTQVSLAKISLFHSFSNISAELGNNQLSIWFPDGAGYKEYPITIADGYYSIDTFSTWLKEKMDERYLYLLQGETKFYPIFFGTNDSYQTISVMYRVPVNTSKHASAEWALPTGTASPYITWNTVLSGLFGYQNTQLGQGLATELIKSTFVPQNSINSLIVSCNLINNSRLSTPSDILSAFPIAGTDFGGIINVISSKMSWIDVVESGAYNELVVSFHDQNQKRIKIVDTNVLILLSFKTL